MAPTDAGSTIAHRLVPRACLYVRSVHNVKADTVMMPPPRPVIPENIPAPPMIAVGNRRDEAVLATVQNRLSLYCAECRRRRRRRKHPLANLNPSHRSCTGGFEPLPGCAALFFRKVQLLLPIELDHVRLVSSILIRFQSRAKP